MRKIYKTVAVVSEDMHRISDEITECVSEKDRYRTALLFEEAFVNIANYAYPDELQNEDRPVTILFDVSEKGSFLIFIDRGRVFDPCAYQPPNPDARLTGGHGIRIIQKFSKGLEYRRVYETNQLRIQL